MNYLTFSAGLSLEALLSLNSSATLKPISRPLRSLLSLHALKSLIKFL